MDIVDPHYISSIHWGLVFPIITGKTFLLIVSPVECKDSIRKRPAKNGRVSVHMGDKRKEL